MNSVVSADIFPLSKHPKDNNVAPIAVHGNETEARPYKPHNAVCLFHVDPVSVPKLPDARNVVQDQVCARANRPLTDSQGSWSSLIV